MASVKDGDRVRIAAREATDEDFKSEMYFTHYGGLMGTVQKVYGKGEVAVSIEPESLTREVRKRHEDVRDQMKTKWLEGLSEEGRSKLTEREKDFVLRYVVLVSADDLESAGARAKTEPREAKSKTDSVPAPQAAVASLETAAPRKTLEEIEAAEAAELARRATG